MAHFPFNRKLLFTFVYMSVCDKLKKLLSPNCLKKFLVGCLIGNKICFGVIRSKKLIRNSYDCWTGPKNTGSAASAVCCLQVFLSLSLSLSLRFNGHFSRVNLGYPVFIGAKDNASGGDNWSYKTRKAPVKSSTVHQQTNTQHFKSRK